MGSDLSAALDALRHGGTTADVAERLGDTQAEAKRVVDRLRLLGHVRRAGSLEAIGARQREAAVFEHTESGRAAWLESLR